MSHTYLIDLYELIDQRLTDIAKEHKGKQITANDISFQEGRSESLSAFRRFIAEHYDCKLPRRLRNKYTTSP